MNVAFLSLGGNMGNRLENLSSALAAITSRCGIIIKSSSVYETEAWGISGAQNYLNQVIKVETELNAESLLQNLLAIEKEKGRIREGHQYSDRTIDVDILFFNDAIIQSENLQIPHPRLHLRKFVLVPLAEIEEELEHPELKKTITELLMQCGDPLKVKKM